jgi:putative ATP-dependent endonuclease of OLD family
MAKKAATPTGNDGAIPTDVHTKLRKLIISNLGCIGTEPVTIDLDDIVVLVGKNNTGKSTILRAYEVLFASSKPALTLEDFPNRKIDPDNLPTIELHTKVDANPPGNKWIGVIEGENIVRERWTWTEPGEAKRQGFDVTLDEWSENVPWGAANVANSRRPRPHRIQAFASPEEQTQAVVKLLLATLQNTVKSLPTAIKDAEGNEIQSDYGKLLQNLAIVQKSVVEQAQEQIEHAQLHLTTLIQTVFRGYRIKFDAQAEEDLTTCLNFFKPGAVLRMGPENGHLSAAEKQGSGARRTLMWAALKYAAEKKADDGGTRPNLLLLDEPELCLHPDAIREACSVLYNLPAGGNWQVMVTTHAPAFIDLSRDNTTVVRVERDTDGDMIRGTTVFRPSNANLSADEKEELKMLNLCDPHLCEFFFGGKTVIVEGDTEHTAFKYAINSFPDDPRLKDVHIIRARGKATICLVAKILNQFGGKYAVLHDSDSPTIFRRKKGSSETIEVTNGAWTSNSTIRDAVAEGIKAARVRLVASIPNFEGPFFGEEVDEDKPFYAWNQMKENNAICTNVKALLYSLLDHTVEVPVECAEWEQEDVLLKRWQAYHAPEAPSESSSEAIPKAK